MNWVGGDPTSNLAFILRTLTVSDAHLPQLWNSNMYLTTEAMKLLDDVMDLYLADFKYGNDKCAKRLSKIDNYWSIITRNHLHAREHAELIIRHLVLPNHIDCCSIPILDWIADNLENVRVNVMAQYHPEWQANDYKDINRRLKNGEFARALNHAKDIGLNLTR